MTAMQKQGAALNKIGALNPFQKCPHCDERGGFYKSFSPKAVGWRLWCYLCGWKV